MDEAAAVAVEDVDEAEDEAALVMEEDEAALVMEEDEAALVMEIEVDREWSTAETAALEEVEEEQEEVVEALR